ncbi:MAG: hemerythrin domain-containing protein [Myxococcaceae bacterium]
MSKLTSESSEDVLEVLLDCHQRLRQVTALAAGLTSASDAVGTVAAKVLRYFTVALPLHEEDEEGSLFPRLLEQAPELAPTLAALRADHQLQTEQVEVLVALCQQVQSWPERTGHLVGALAAAGLALQKAWQGHLDSEERDVFPAARRVLSSEARAAIRGEMRARRARLPQ